MQFFEVSTYYFIAQGIDGIEFLITGKQSDWGLTVFECVVIAVGAVALRFILFQSEQAFRRLGQKISFDLRESFLSPCYNRAPISLERIGVGDLMTRAIQDISLIQRLIAFGLIQVVIMIYAPLFGMTAMMMKSVTLTLLILPLLPILYIYAQYVAADGRVSRIVQETLAALGSHTQENLSGIRTVQAGAQEANEIARFSKPMIATLAPFYEQSRINSLMTAWTPWLTVVLSWSS